MNRELEELILAREAMLEAQSGTDAKRLAAAYHASLDGTHARHAGLDREKLRQLVERAHLRWLVAQNKPTSIPPKA